MHDYYDENAEEYAALTLNVDMSEIRSRFVRYVRPGGSILDAGCGSGRDTIAFSRLGYAVVAVDASPRMAAVARRTTGVDVREARIEDLTFDKQFDGVWASASLVHMKPDVLRRALEKLILALTPGGHLYVSFRHGEGMKVEGQRCYYDQDERSLRQMLLRSPSLAVLDMWMTCSESDGRGVRWLNAVCRRVELPPSN